MLSRAALRLAQPAAVSRWATAAPSRRALPVLTAGPAALRRGMARDNKPGSRSSTPKAGSTKPSDTQQQTSPSLHKPVSSEPIQDAKPSRDADAQAAKPTEPTRAKSSDIPQTPDKQIPLSELPDLTQGIPSTLEYEGTAATGKAALETVEEGASTSSGGRGKGELPASAYISSTDRRRQKLANYMFAASLAGMVGGVVYLGRNWDDDVEMKHADAPNGWGLSLWWNRASARMKEFLTYYHEPAFEKLLPDPDPSFERPYTLVISLEDIIIHDEWTREHGWRIAKRPGADYFLRYLSQYYELVLWTTVQFALGEPLLRKLDPYHIVTWPLFKEATKFEDGTLVKDLSYLNRDLSKVIILETNPEYVRKQPENAIILPKWSGDPKDKDLVALIPFLEYIYAMNYNDVRKVIKSFEGKHIPTEFARREAIARKEFNKQLEEERKKHPHRGKSGMAALGSLFGLKPQNLSVMVLPEGEQNPAEAFAQGKMLQDIARERGQRGYAEMEKFIRENGEKWLKDEQAAQEKLQQQAMADMKNSFAGWFLPGSGSKRPVEDKKNEEERKAQ